MIAPYDAWSWVTILLLASSLVAGCSSSIPGTSTAAAPLAELTFYDWADDMPVEVLSGFTAATGMRVRYLTYRNQEEAAANLRAGQVYDVVVMDNPLIPALVRDGLLAEIDYRNVPNYKNISANFRDLISDPHNYHTVPFNWGTTGLVVRGDLFGPVPVHWTDLWDQRLAGRVGVLNSQRYLLGAALKSLGYSANSEEPAHLQAALQRLLELPAGTMLLDYSPQDLDSAVVDGRALVAMTWSGDAHRLHTRRPGATYILPEEGTLLWGDNFVIPAASPNKAAAEILINYLLRPEVGALIARRNYYATANEAALPIILPALRADTVIFPPAETLVRAEILMPLSPAGQALYDETWQRFLDNF